METQATSSNGFGPLVSPHWFRPGGRPSVSAQWFRPKGFGPKEVVIDGGTGPYKDGGRHIEGGGTGPSKDGGRHNQVYVHV